MDSTRLGSGQEMTTVWSWLQTVILFLVLNSRCGVDNVRCYDTSASHPMRLLSRVPKEKRAHLPDPLSGPAPEYEQ